VPLRGLCFTAGDMQANQVVVSPEGIGPSGSLFQQILNGRTHVTGVDAYHCPKDGGGAKVAATGR